MSAAAFFASARALKRELTGETAVGLTQEEVDDLNAVVKRWKPKANPTKLEVPAKFFQMVRAAFGSLEQEQVDGFNFLLAAMGAARWPLAWVAYGLATAWHETAHTMQPVQEAYWKDDDWRRRNLRYYPWHGRGYVQLTWEANYKRADEECELNGALLADRTKAMNPQLAAQIMVKGMEQGWFTNKRLADYLPISGEAGHEAFKQARRIINGQDKAAEIAKEAIAFQSALAEGGWA